MRNVLRPTELLLPLKRAHPPRVSVRSASLKDRSQYASERRQVTSVIDLSTNDLLPNRE